MVVKDSWYLTSYTAGKPIWIYMQPKKSSLDIHAVKNQVRGCREKKGALNHIELLPWLRNTH